MPRYPSRSISIIVVLALPILFSLPSSTSSSRAADTSAGKALEPDVAEASEEPSEVVAGIRVPAGLEIDVFAAEPEVANIVAFDIDHQGRLYVCESFRQNRGVTDNRGHDEEWLLADLSAQTVQDRIDYHNRLLGDAAVTYAQHDDRVRRLVDTDGDGRADESKVVVNGFNRIEEGTGAGILVRGNELYYTCIPKLWKLVDADGDGVTDERITLSDGFGVRVAFRGHDLHGIIRGVDGRLYFSIGDRGFHVTTREGELIAAPDVGAVFRCEMDGSGLQVYCTGLRNPQELAFNDIGDLFSVDNNSDSGDKARIVHLLQGGDSGWRMYYQYLPDRGPFNRERIWEPFHQEQPAYIVPPIANFTDGPSGLVHYPGTGFGDRWKNKFLICDFRGGASNSGIRSFELAADGAFYSLASDDQPIWNVLATDVAFGPRGGLYVSDWVDGWNGLGKGRIYRITDPQHSDSPIVAQVRSILSGDYNERSKEDLVGDLSHRDRRVRSEAQWELAERGEAEALLAVILDSTADRSARLHAIWGVDQIVRTAPPGPETDKLAKLVLSGVRDLLGCKDDVLRAAAAKFAGERADPAAIPRLLELMSDTSPRVRYFVTMAMAETRQPRALDAVVAMLEANDNKDPALRHAGVMYMAALADETGIAGLASHSSGAVRRAAVVALRRISSARLKDFLADPSDLVVAEAARAIYDKPVPAVLPDLAAQVNRDSDNPELIHRVLAANYRLGEQGNAVALARFAADEAAALSMRIEALDMLADWQTTDPRDRYLNDVRRLDPRDNGIAAAALRTEIQRLMSSQADVREKAIDVASSLGLKEIIPGLIKRIGNNDRTAATRASALVALARLDSATAVKLARNIPDPPAGELTEAAIGVLAQHAAGESVGRFVASTSSPRLQVRQKAWDILATIDAPEATQAVADAVKDYVAGTLPAEVELNVLQAAAKRVPETANLIAEHQNSLAASEPLAAWWSARAGGDPAEGAELFFGKTELSCVRCHKVDRAGGEVGPDLTLIGKENDPRYLLEAVCLPDATIAKGYETAVIANEDGQVITGIVKTENDEFVELTQADGSQRRIFQDEIVVRKKGKSSMPADLAKLISPRELRDLVAYLSSLKVDPRATTDVE